MKQPTLNRERRTGVRRLVTGLLLGGLVLAGCADETTGTAPRLEGGISLAEAHPTLVKQCAEAADRLGFPVPCPRWIPPTADGLPYKCETDCVGAAGEAATPTFFLNIEEFSAPQDYVGTCLGAGHVVIGARRHADSPPRPCFDGERIAQPETSGHAVSVYECPARSERLQREIMHGEGAHVDHLLFAWTRHGIDYVVSAHGHTNANRELLTRIVRSIELVEPSST